VQQRIPNRSAAVRDARVSIWATVLFGPIGRHLALTTISTWRGWTEKPRWFWRTFTAASLIVAAIAGSCWPMVGGNGLYKAVFGESFFTQTPQQRGTGIEFPFVYVTLCYIFWSLALLPHTLVRIGWLIVRRHESQREEPND
jgi:hypothetical protein